MSFAELPFPSLDSLRWAEDIRTAAAFVGELAASRGLAAGRYLACHKHRLKVLRIKAKVR